MSPRESKLRAHAALAILALLVACGSDDTPDSAIATLDAAVKNKSGAAGVDEDQVRAALDTIGKHPTPQARALVIDLSTDVAVPEDVRFAAVVVLGRIGGVEARQTLERLTKDDPSDLVREEAASALSHLTGGP